jgi:hypothetical protein
MAKSFAVCLLREGASSKAKPEAGLLFLQNRNIAMDEEVVEMLRAMEGYMWQYYLSTALTTSPRGRRE